MRNLVCLLLLLVPVVAPAAEWYPGIIHVHTTFSDGFDNVPQRVAKAKTRGYRFIIITDHYEQIETRDKGSTKYFQKLANYSGPDFGLSDYLRNCREQTSGDFATIPGAEIEAIWRDDDGMDEHSHTLALGWPGDTCRFGSTTPMQDEILAWLNQPANGPMLSVAAHPTTISNLQAKWPPWEGYRCRYDLGTAEAYGELKGIEFFNGDNDEQDEAVYPIYQRLLQEPRAVFVTAGCDSHSNGDTRDDARWQRVTRVYADSLDPSSLLAGIKSGRTYAAQYGASLTSISPLPGEHVTVNLATITATVTFPSRTGSSKEFVIYRDGIEASGSRQAKPAGKISYDYEWTDAQADGKEHSYVLRVGNVLITSPAYCRTRTPAPQAADTLTYVEDGDIVPCAPYGGQPAINRINLSRLGVTPKSDFQWSPSGRYILIDQHLVVDRTGTNVCVLSGEDGQPISPTWGGGPSANWADRDDNLIVVCGGSARVRTLEGTELFSTPDEDIQFASLSNGVLVAVHATPAADGGTYHAWLTARRLTGGKVVRHDSPEYYAKMPPEGRPIFLSDGSRFHVRQYFMHGGFENWYQLGTSLQITPLFGPGTGKGPAAIGPDGSCYFVDTYLGSTSDMLNSTFDNPKGYRPTVSRRTPGGVVQSMPRCIWPAYIPRLEVSPSGRCVAIEVLRAKPGQDTLSPVVWLWQPDAGMISNSNGAGLPHWLPSDGDGR